MKRRIAVKVLYLLVLAADQAHPATFRGLGDLEGGEFISLAADVSADGSLIVGASMNEYGIVPTQWAKSDDFQPTVILDTPFATGVAEGVSGDGSVVVGAREEYGALHPYRVSGQASEAQLQWSGEPGTAVRSSHDGSIVVGHRPSSAFGVEAVRWDVDGRMERLRGRTSFHSTVANDVSSNGRTVVGVSIDLITGVAEAVSWTDGSAPEHLGVLPGYRHSTARAVSADASTVVGWSESTSQMQAAVWTEDGIQGLGFLAEHHNVSSAIDVSADGSVVVGASGTASVLGGETPRAFIWDGVHGMRDLRDVLNEEYRIDTTDWELLAPTGISADGETIVGLGLNPSQQPQAWMVDLRPTQLQPGDANQDLSFDQLDLVQVLRAQKYEKPRLATWGEGDWNAGPGGQPGDPPTGDGRFDRLDIVAALATDLYLAGPYGSVPSTSEGKEALSSIARDSLYQSTANDNEDSISFAISPQQLLPGDHAVDGTHPDNHLVIGRIGANPGSTLAPVPEPSTVTLAFLGLLLIAVRRPCGQRGQHLVRSGCLTALRA